MFLRSDQESAPSVLKREREKRGDDSQWAAPGRRREAGHGKRDVGGRPSHVTLAAAMTAPEAEVRVLQREVKHTQPQRSSILGS